MEHASNATPPERLSSPSDEELIKEAWQYARRVARGAAKSIDEAEDAAAAVIVRYIERLRSNNEIRTWRPYIKTAVLNELRSRGSRRVRDTNREILYTKKHERVAPMPPDPLDMAWRADFARYVGAASLRHLTEQQLAYLHLVIQNKTAQEVTDLVENTRGGVDQTIHRAIGKIYEIARESEMGVAELETLQKDKAAMRKHRGKKEDTA